ncbi:MAG TPA: hypothetical protein VGK59_22385 [Ohtaekwangia sp.]
MKGIIILFATLVLSSSLYAQWLTSGTHLYNSNTGNVGIGTGSAFTPQMKLEVIGFGQVIRNTPANNYTTLRLYNDQNSSSRSLEIDYSGSQYGSAALTTGGPTGESAAITTTGAFPLTFGTANTARMTISSLGDVGIGALPEAGVRLSLINSATWQMNMRNSEAGGATWWLGSSSNSWNAGGGKFIISTTSSSTDAAFVIDGQKRIGLGTTAPAYKLDVAGTINATAFYVNGVPFNGGSSQWITSGTNINYNTTGMVSIGTTTAPAGYKLAVGGKVVAEEIVVKLRGDWPDYVFESSYKLLSLTELEKFIIANKHLPGVPTAIQVKENGLSVGEMNVILLQKVEELTLLLINKEKEKNLIFEELETIKERLVKIENQIKN